ncbi:flippase [Mucilaginibacter psychrotolerans]|uniref:Flippase n=1 Tax=Mucilaginibacter psychrotolerans TaxID=1524096 RepID=A0A4Y8SJT0_9SPHI|nr:flippase [Mucilaginibacter psychrotolerans]TFF38787.1 flippase [Mucilaginibacter psychrotolerans]
MNIKKNFLYNSILLVSQYIFPMLVFPYTSRVLGVDKIGLVNFADGIVNNFILFSTMGLTITGIREVARYKNDRLQINRVFSELLVIHLIMTAIVSVIYVIAIYNYAKFSDHKALYLIGLSKLICNVFLIEWFFRGIENFKFITLRTVIIKTVYVALVFLTVKQKDDYNIFFILTCGMTVINGLVNCWYARNYVSVAFKNLDLNRHFKFFFTMGLYLILTNMYTTFNVAYLGFVANDTSVGLYSTSLKIFTIILGLFTALNTVLVPRLSSLIAEDRHEEFISLINKSTILISAICFPIIMLSEVLAPQIIHIIAGEGYDGAIICFRIIIPQIFLVGISQILSNQILMSLKLDNKLAITSFYGAVVGVLLTIIYVPRYREVGTSIVVLISELVVTFVLYYFCTVTARVKLPLLNILKNLVLSVPYLLIAYLCAISISNGLVTLLLAGTISLIYFALSQIYLMKNEILLAFVAKGRLKLATLK